MQKFPSCLDTPINMADTCHLGVWKFILVITTSLIFLAIKCFFGVWMRWFYAWSWMKIYMMNLFHHYSFSGPTLGLVEYFSDSKFSCHFSFFLYTFWSLSVSARKRIWPVWTFETHSLVRNSHQNYSNIVCFRCYQRISVSAEINAKCR